MIKQKIFVSVLSIINLAWVGYALDLYFGWQSHGHGDVYLLLIMLIPLFVGIITFLFFRFVKKFVCLRALKYANVIAIFPLGVIGGLVLYSTSGPGVATAGIPPI